jgi:glyoxylase-like metal-dependent hydrolase (beta-lactamase superfamily II)
VIVVDTGIDQPQDGMLAGNTVTGSGLEPITNELASHGLDTDDVDYVILTHLHYAHICNNDLFPNADFV